MQRRTYGTMTLAGAIEERGRRASMTTRDFYTSYGAGTLARIIEAFWHGRGYAGIRAERYVLPGGLFGVRSNIGPTGYPPRTAAPIIDNT